MNTLKLGASGLILMLAPLFLWTLEPALASDSNTSVVIQSTATGASLERGKYLVNTSGCHDCHTPFQPGPNGPEPDMSRMLSGHPEELVMPPVPSLPEGPWQIVVSGTATAHAGPWGTSYTANLTPDLETGLGKWTTRDFVDTIRTGRHLGRGRVILPPMPIPVYKQMTDADLESIFIYLQSIPAISNQVPDPVVAEEG